MPKKINLSATALKYIAIIAMTIDHIAFVFLPVDSIAYYFMRLIGKLTAPIMSYFIVEGFIHTRSRKKYFLRLLIFAIISQPFYSIMLFGRTTNAIEFMTHLNVMFTFCVSLLSLKILSSIRLSLGVKLFMLGGCFAFADICDWAFIIPAWSIIFFLFREEKVKKYLLFAVVSVILLVLRYLPTFDSFIQFTYMFGVLLALIPISLYNGKRSLTENALLKKINRWGFYIYYPLHILILVVIKNIMAK